MNTHIECKYKQEGGKSRTYQVNQMKKKTITKINEICEKIEEFDR